MIRQAIHRQGRVTFAHFMELALYHPEVGYYSRRVQVGGEGDFYTSPELHPFFAAAVAAQAHALWTQLGRPGGFEIVEVGGGSGRFARDFLRHVDAQKPDFSAALSYRIDDASATLREQQRQRLAGAGLDGRVKWSTSRAEDWAAESITGVVIANELLDALPVHIVTRVDGALHELYVEERDGDFRFERGPLSRPEIGQYFDELGLEIAEGADAEVNLAALEWLRRTAASLRAGGLVLMDYGYEAPVLYAPHRLQGTLLCYADHAVSSDPLAQPGEQDITTHVDFTTTRRTLQRCGLDVLWQGPQRTVLARSGYEDWAAAAESAQDQWSDRSAAMRSLQALMDPDGLGKIEWLAATKDIDIGPLASGPLPAEVPLSVMLSDHLRLPDPSWMDPVPDIEQQWRELWDGDEDDDTSVRA